MEISFWESFFGEKDESNNRFINKFNTLLPQFNQYWGVKRAIWIDTNNAWELFLSIPELRAVIDKRASMMASNIPKLFDKNGTEITKHWFLDMVAKPNSMQSWSDVVYSLSVNDALYSNAFGYCPKRSFDTRNLFVPLPSNKIQINTSGKQLKQMDIDGLVNDYKFQYDDQNVETIEVGDMVYLVTTDGMNIIKPTSRISALKYPLSNIKASYHKRNVLLENMGSIGILTAQKSDIGGSIPMDDDEKKQIQRDWFNRSKDEIIITESNVDFKPMSFPTKDLMLFEELDADKIAIIDAYGLNYDIFSSVKGSTYANVQNAIRMCYTDTIIPETQQMYDTMAHQLGLSKDGITIKADFSHLPILQDDEEKKAKVLNTRADALNKIILAGVVLTDDEKLAIISIQK